MSVSHPRVAMEVERSDGYSGRRIFRKYPKDLKFEERVGILVDA